MTALKESIRIVDIQDPEVYIALKRLCSFIISDIWQTSSTDLEFEFAIAKTKVYEQDIRALAGIDIEVAWGQTQHMTEKGVSIVYGENDFNPWYKGELTLRDLIESIELIADLLDSSTPRYLPETEFLHYYHYLLGRLPTNAIEPAIIRISSLHPKIRQHCRERFDNEHYADAILTAYKVVFNEIKGITGIRNLDGKQLAEKAFSLSDPIIMLNDLITQSEKDEQLGFMLLFSGAAVGIRNPKAHDLIEQEDRHKTLRYLAFASLLMDRLDERNAPFSTSL